MFKDDPVKDLVDIHLKIILVWIIFSFRNSIVLHFWSETCSRSNSYYSKTYRFL